jgi:hypothetical protein
VTPVNDEQLIASNTGVTVAEGSSGTLITSAMLAASDVDNSPAQLLYTLSSAPANGTLRLNGVALGAGATFSQADVDAGRLSYDHDGTETLSDAFGFSVDDGAGAVSSGSFAITVTPLNDNAPLITSNGGGANAVVNVAENSTAVATVAASDADLPAQALSYSIVSGADAARFTIDANSGALSFVTAPDRESPGDANADNVYDVIVQVSDGSNLDTQALAVTVTNVNETPAAVADLFAWSGSAPLVIARTQLTGNDADIDGDTLAIVSVTQPQFGVLQTNPDGSYAYLTAPGFSGNDTFSYVVADAGGLTATATVTVVVTPTTPILPAGSPPANDTAAAPGGAPPSRGNSVEPFAPKTPAPVAASGPAGSTGPLPPDDAAPVTAPAAYAVPPMIPPGSPPGVMDDPDDDRHNRANMIAKSIFDLSTDATTFSNSNGAVPGERLALFANFWNALDEFRRQLDEASGLNDERQKMIVQLVSGSGLVLSAGLVTWILRGGALAASLLTALPSWAQFDPIPVLAARRRAQNRPEKEQEPLDHATERAVAAVFRKRDKSGASTAAVESRT